MKTNSKSLNYLRRIPGVSRPSPGGGTSGVSVNRRFRFPAAAFIIVSILFAQLFITGCAKKLEENKAKKAAIAMQPVTPHMPAAELAKRIAIYAQVNVSYDESVLSKPEKEALAKLIEAGRIMDEIFLRQVWSGNVDMRAALERAVNAGAKEAEALSHFYHINFGPWDRIAEDAPFIGTAAKPKGANFYPEDITKEEFDNYTKAHPADAEIMRGFFTTIRRDAAGLKAVPYSEEYKSLLAKAAALQNEAADILTIPANAALLTDGIDYKTLASFLRSRAAAYASNDYYQSDMDWMDVKNNIIDVTIGPYEVYEDALFGYKASFEAFIAIRNPEDSKNLEGLKGYLQKLENNLPIPSKHKNPNRGGESPISVVDVVFAAGDTKAGVQTIAFNLPNDERVREAKGSKKVMLKNISRAKFDKILIPIAEMLLDTEQMKYVDFKTYFNSTLMHEFAHGLGPGNITLAGGKKTTVSRELQDLYSAIEEAKADIAGLYNTAYLEKAGYFPAGSSEKAYVTFLPGFFRAIRFGVHEAHGKANMMEFNFLREHDALNFDHTTEKYHVKLDKMPEAVEVMTNALLMIEATGDYEAAKKFIDYYAEMPSQMEGLMAKLDKIPIDIEPVYPADR